MARVHRARDFGMPGRTAAHGKFLRRRWPSEIGRKAKFANIGIQ